jgi:hypothetical protein
MRARPALLAALAAALAMGGCSGPGPVHRKPSATELPAARNIGCDQAIIQVGAAETNRTVLGVIQVPPAHLSAAVPTGSEPWSYFRKYGLAIRANSPAVLVTVPPAWRHAAAIVWGNNAGPFSSLRLLRCPAQVGPWNAYAGGFYLHSSSGCVPLVVQVGRRTVTLQFAIGRKCAPL